MLCLDNAKLLGTFFSHFIYKNFKILKILMSKWTNKKQINIGQENIGMGKVSHVHIETNPPPNQKRNLSFHQRLPHLMDDV
jgi:hypothetical protein